MSESVQWGKVIDLWARRTAEYEADPKVKHVMIFENTLFNEPGLYNFNLFIDGRQEAAVPLHLEHMPDPSAPSKN